MCCSLTEALLVTDTVTLVATNMAYTQTDKVHDVYL